MICEQPSRDNQSSKGIITKAFAEKYNTNLIKTQNYTGSKQ